MEINSHLDTAKIYTDFGGLAKLRREAQQGSDEATLEVAKQLEGVFLQMVLKSMRKANEVFSEKGIFGSNQMKFYQEMFDQQLSISMTNGDGLGLAEVLAEQLGQYTSDKSSTIQTLGEQKAQASQSSVDLKDKVNAWVNQLKATTAVTETKPQSDTTTNEDATTVKENTESFIDKVAHGIKKFASPEQFVQTLFPIANEVAKQFGFDPKMLLAQSALETGWGKKIMKHASGDSSHNLFGIKADRRWQGDQVNVNTLEYRQGVARKERANFRAYESFKQSFEDFAKFLQDNKRYQKALSVSDQPTNFIQEIQNAGYATDPNYADKVTKIFNSTIMRDAAKEWSDL